MFPALLKPATHYRFLMYQLVQREIKARYKQSFVGYAWILVNPLAQLLVYTFVFSVVIRFSVPEAPYPLFLLTALLPWIFLQTSLTNSALSLVDNAPLLRKIAFPRETILYSVVAAKLIDLLVASVIFLFFFAFYRIVPSVNFWIILPLLLIQVFLVTGFSLFLSAANLFYRDFQYLTNLLLMIWFYLTPIVYPLDKVPQNILPLYQLNPLVGIFSGYRSALFGLPLDWPLIGWSAVVSILIFFLSWVWFKKVEGTFADIV